MSFDHERFDHTQRAPDVSVDFGHEMTAPALARRAVDPILREDGIWSSDVKLATSEMVSNVVAHTGNGGHLDAWDDDPLVISVSDTDPRPPVPREAPDGVGGLGLGIVGRVADDWGVEPTREGKRVWARFSRPKG